MCEKALYEKIVKGKEGILRIKIGYVTRVAFFKRLHYYELYFLSNLGSNFPAFTVNVKRYFLQNITVFNVLKSLCYSSESICSFTLSSCFLFFVSHPLNTSYLAPAPTSLSPVQTQRRLKLGSL